MKLTVVTVDLDENKESIRNCDCHKNEILKHCWRETDENFNWDQRKMLIEKAGKFLGRSKKPYIL